MKFKSKISKNKVNEFSEYLVENLNGGRGIFFPKQGEKHFDGWGG